MSSFMTPPLDPDPQLSQPAIVELALEPLFEKPVGELADSFPLRPGNQIRCNRLELTHRTLGIRL